MATFNQSPIDLWTAVHAVSGYQLARHNVPRWQAYFLIAGVELLEFVLRDRSPFFRESPVNAFVDVLVGVTAYELARQ